MLYLDGTQKIALAESHRAAGKNAPVPQRAAGHGDLIVELIHIVDVDGAYGGEVPLIGVVRSFGVFDVGRKLGDQKVQVGVTCDIFPPRRRLRCVT